MSPDQYCRDKLACVASSAHYSLLFLPAARRRAATALYALRREFAEAIENASDPARTQARARARDREDPEGARRGRACPPGPDRVSDAGPARLRRETGRPVGSALWGGFRPADGPAGRARARRAALGGRPAAGAAAARPGTRHHPGRAVRDAAGRAGAQRLPRAA